MAEKPKKLAVIGAGPAGLAFATTAASRGHQVTLFDAADQIGGQFNIAKQIPGKEEFHETLRYFRRQLALREVTVRLGVKVEAADLSEFDEVILACGIVPRTPDIPGIGHAKVLSYLDVLRDKNRSASGWRSSAPAASASTPPSTSASTACPAAWIRRNSTANGASTAALSSAAGWRRKGPGTRAARQIYLLQRKTSKVGEGTGKPPVGSTAPARRCAA